MPERLSGEFEWSFVMRDLNQVEIFSVSGSGVPLLLAIAAFVYYEREHIGDFVTGALEGYEETRAKHK